MMMVVVACSLAFTTGTVVGELIVDDDDVSLKWADHNNITAAMDASTEGEVIYVYAGSYNETVLVNKTVSIIGNGSADTFVFYDTLSDIIHIESDWVNITGLNVSGSEDSSGIDIRGQYSTVDNCTIHDSDEGIRPAASYVTIDNCTIYDCGYGTFSAYTPYVTINWCTFWDIPSYEAINGYRSSSMTLLNNTFIDSSIDLGGWLPSDYDSHEIWDCTVNGDPVYYLANTNGHTVPSGTYGQVILGDCDDVRMDDVTISDAGNGMLIAFCNDAHLSNVTLRNLSQGMYLRYSDGSLIEDFTIDGIWENGMYIDYCEDIEIARINGTNTGNDRCLYILANNQDVLIRDSVFTGFSYAIYSFATNHTYRNITFKDNNLAIYLRNSLLVNISMCLFSGDNGDIYFRDSDTATIFNNTMKNATGYSVRLESSWNITLTHNEMMGADSYAIRMDGTSGNNSVHHNNFLDNSGSSSQCYDMNGNSSWDDGAEGNWWSDWGGSGNYTIDGSTAADEYPLDDPVATSAPEKVPELGLLVALSMVAFMVIAIRRRRR